MTRRGGTLPDNTLPASASADAAGASGEGPPHAAAAAALAVFPSGAKLDEGIVAAGPVLTFPPRAAWLHVPLDAKVGSFRLDLGVEGPAGVRVELVTSDGPFALPLEPVADGWRACFALEAPVGWLRLAPVEAGPVRFTRFSLAPHPRWQSLLPDWRLGPLRLPAHQGVSGPVETSLPTPPGWDARLSIEAQESLSLAGDAADCGRCGALLLAVTPPLRPGLHLIEADFSDRDGVPAWVAPRLHLAGAAPNTPPAAHFRRRRGSRYLARLVLREAADRLVFQPRQERGAVRIESLSIRSPGPVGRALSLAGEGWRVFAPRLLAPLDRLTGEDPGRDGPLRALLRLLTRADLRYRLSLRRGEGERVRRWLARPVLRPGVLRVFIGPGPDDARAATAASVGACGDPDWESADRAAEADIVVPAGARLAPHALAVLRRVPPGEPPAFDTDRLTLGLRSAPRFRAAGAGAVPLVLAHLPRGADASPLPQPAVRRGAAPSIAVVTATRDAPDHLSRFLETLQRTWPPEAALILIDNASRDRAALDRLARAKREPGVRVVEDDRPFNFAALSNLGADLARADILVFANNDIEFRYAGWAEALSAALGVEGAGVAGGRLDYPDGRVQHAGIVLAGEARVRHIERFSPAGDVGYFARRRGITAVTAVTGALMAVRRDDFLGLGGFAAARYPVLYNDVDFCLRARKAGLGVVLAAEARAVHHESVTFGARQDRDVRARGGPLWRLERAEEADRFRQDWASLIDADPCYPDACDPVEAAFRASQ